jgi:hypothetical protein
VWSIDHESRAIILAVRPSFSTPEIRGGCILRARVQSGYLNAQAVVFDAMNVKYQCIESGDKFNDDELIAITSAASLLF